MKNTKFIFVLQLVAFTLVSSTFLSAQSKIIVSSSDQLYSAQATNGSVADCLDRGPNTYSGKLSLDGKLLKTDKAIKSRKVKALKRKFKKADSIKKKKKLKKKIKRVKVFYRLRANACDLASPVVQQTPVKPVAPLNCHQANLAKAPVTHNYLQIETPTTLSGHHVITSGISVTSVLTISECTIIEMAAGADLTVVSNGTLRILGSAGKEVIFTSASNYPTPGDWDNIDISSLAVGNNIINHAIFEYGTGGYESFLEVGNGVTLSVDNTTFKDINGGAVKFGSADGLYEINLQSFKNNTFNNISGKYFDGVNANNVGTLSPFNVLNKNSNNVVFINNWVKNNTTYKDLNAPYLINQGSYLVHDNATLTVNPGVTILINASGYGQVKVYGALKLLGTPEDRITVKSSVEGSYFHGIEFGSASNNVFSNVDIQNGGKAGTDKKAQIRIDEEAVFLTLENTVFSNAYPFADCDIYLGFKDYAPYRGTIINNGGNSGTACYRD